MFLAWAVLALVFGFLSSVALVALSGPAMMQLRVYQTGGAANANPQAIFALFGQMLPGFGVVLVLSLIYYAVFYGAGNRAILRPGEGGLGYFRLGKQEALQLAVFVLLFLIFLAVYFVLVAAVVLVAVTVSVGSRPAGVLLAILAGIAALGAMIWLGVRLSLTSAATFDTGRLGFAQSWRLTRGRFWPLFGAYALAWVLMLIIGLLVLIISAAITAVVGGGAAFLNNAFPQPNYASLAAFFTPAAIIQMIIRALFSALAMAVVICAPAYAYRQISGRDGVAVASTFE